MICIAQQLPSRYIGQELLVKTVQLIINSPEDTWQKQFLGALGMDMRDGWSGFTTDDGEDEDDVQTPDEWLNFEFVQCSLVRIRNDAMVQHGYMGARSSLGDGAGA